MNRCLAALALLTIAVTAFGSRAVKVTAHFYRLASTLDTSKIKAIGSAHTKASPTILQVSKQEMKRVADLVEATGAKFLGSPSVITKLGMQAKVETKQDDGSGFSMTVVPDTKSDTITLNFKLTSSTREGRRIVTRSASGVAKVVESRALLLIEDPREGQPGLLIVLEAVRISG